MDLGPFPSGLSQLPGQDTPHRGLLPACCHHPTAYLPQGQQLGFLPVFPDLELLLEFPDLELVLGFPDLELVLVFQALGQVQVRGLQGWAQRRETSLLPTRPPAPHHGTGSKFPTRFS